MGVVHLALDPRGRAVAIKVLRAHVAHDDDARQRLSREVDTLSRIRDARVASVIDADVMAPRPYIVTRYVPGPALDEVVEEHGPLAPADLLRLARGIAEAIRAIHACGVVHRDIKPGNVLIEDGDPVLIDFGIAHLQDDVRHTVGGLVMGTPGYLSPELVEGAAITDATDWWGWAATITYAASGRPPFGRARMDAVLTRVRAGDVDLDGVDPLLVPLLRASLSPDPTAAPARRRGHRRPRAVCRRAGRDGADAERGPVGRRPVGRGAGRHPGRPGRQHGGHAAASAAGHAARRAPDGVPRRPTRRRGGARRRPAPRAPDTRPHGIRPRGRRGRPGRRLLARGGVGRGGARPARGRPPHRAADAHRAAGRGQRRLDRRPHGVAGHRRRRARRPCPRSPAPPTAPSPPSCCAATTSGAGAATCRSRSSRVPGTSSSASSRPWWGCCCRSRVALAGVFATALLLAGTQGTELGPGAPVTLAVGGASACHAVVGARRRLAATWIALHRAASSCRSACAMQIVAGAPATSWASSRSGGHAHGASLTWKPFSGNPFGG